MAEWTPEAREYLDGYLKQVRALARNQGDDADDIAEDLRAHVEREAEDAPGALVTVDYLRGVLAKTGAPEQIAGIEDGLDGWDGNIPSRRETVDTPRRQNRKSHAEPDGLDTSGPRVDVRSPVCTSAPRVASPSKRIAVACAVSASLFLSVTLFAVQKYLKHHDAPQGTVIQGEMWVEPYPDSVNESLNANVSHTQAISGNEAAARDIIQEIKSAQEKFQEEKRLDLDGDGVGDYGTLEQLTTPGEGGDILLDEEFPSGVSHDYRFIIEVCPSGLDGSPHYQCVAIDTKPGLKKTRCFHLDERGVVSRLGSWEQDTQYVDDQYGVIMR